MIKIGLIYLYTNKINGRQYVGQTTRNLKIRHRQHLGQHETYFDRALQKYGENNFELTILEDDIGSQEELNAKEEYYIAKYDTFNNGYNMNRGGDNKTRLSEKLRDRVIDLLKNTNKSSKEIAIETGISIWTVNDFNTGDALKKTDEEYPIRKNGCWRYTLDDIEAVISLLQDTNFSFEKIADITNTNFHFVADINKGKRSFLFQNEYSFPIRQTVKHTPVNIELANTIIKMLKEETDLSADQIGDRLCISGYTVGSVNRGKHSICSQISEIYPIRRKQHRSHTNYFKRKLLDEQVLQIVELLVNTSVSTEELGQRYGVDRSAINRINQGVVFKPLLSKFKFPIRQNKSYNQSILNSVA